MIEYFIENKKKIIILLLLVIFLFVISIILNNKDEKKVYVSENYIYTKESYVYDDKTITEYPYINLKGEAINNINEEIMTLYYEMLAIEEQFMKYDYYVSGNILSLVIGIYYREAPDVSSEMLFYNIDISDIKILTDGQLFDYYNVNRNDVINVVDNELREYYRYELSKKYIDSGCDFNCYLSETDSLPILDECGYYVKDNTLYAYKKINLDSEFYYDGDSGFDLFNYKIADK